MKRTKWFILAWISGLMPVFISAIMFPFSYLMANKANEMVAEGKRIDSITLFAMNIAKVWHNFWWAIILLLVPLGMAFTAFFWVIAYRCKEKP